MANGLSGMGDIGRIDPFETMWKGLLAATFRDPRLQQLFGRYAQPIAAPRRSAPATLMLVAHVEQAGVWSVKGGMHRAGAWRSSDSLSARASRFRFGRRGDAESAPPSGARIGREHREERHRVSTPSSSMPTSQCGRHAGCFGDGREARGGAGHPRQRSLSAITWAAVA